MNITSSDVNFAIVVLSCDKYSDLWPGFFCQLKKMLDIPIKKYLITNELDYNDSYTCNLEVVKTGKDKNWSSNTLHALEIISEKKVLIILEDIFIASKIENEDLIRLVKFSIENDIQHIKYMSDPPPKIPFNKQLGRYEIGMPYLVSVCGIWDKEYLKQIIIEGENPWEFEVNGSYRAKFSATHFYGCLKPLFQYKNMVEKGGWTAPNIHWAKNNKIPIKIELRKINNVYVYHLKKIIFTFSMLTPWRVRVRIISILKKILSTY